MGLDMYLRKRTWILAGDATEGIIEIKAGNVAFKADVSKVSCIVERVGYWRKANQIHRWFIEKCNDGIDDCRPIILSDEKLLRLKADCEAVLLDHSKAETLMPTMDGFFFGSTDYGDWYFEALQDTMKFLEGLPLPRGSSESWASVFCDYEYQASW